MIKQIEKIFYRRPLFYVSFIVILIGFLSVWSSFEQKESYTNGINVYASVIEQPKNCESLNRTSYIKLEYDKHIYIRSVGPGYCDKIGKSKILVRIDTKNNSLFFIEDKLDNEIIYSLIILLIGLIIAYKGWKK